MKYRTRAPLYRYSVNLQPIGVFAHEVGIAGATLVVAALHSLRARLPMFVAGSALVLLPQKRLTIVATVLLGVVWVAHVRPRRLGVVLAALAIVGLLFTVVPDLRQVWDREQAAPEAENILSYRTAIFEASVNRAAEHPVLGGGLGVGDRNLLLPIGRPGTEFATHGELETSLAATGMIGTVLEVVDYIDLVRRGCGCCGGQATGCPSALSWQCWSVRPSRPWCSGQFIRSPTSSSFCRWDLGALPLPDGHIDSTARFGGHSAQGRICPRQTVDEQTGASAKRRHADHEPAFDLDDLRPASLDDEKDSGSGQGCDAVTPRSHARSVRAPTPDPRAAGCLNPSNVPCRRAKS